MKKRFIINLLNFADSQIAGAGIFAKNLLRAWFSQPILPDIVIYHAASADVRSIFGLTEIQGVAYRPVVIKSFLQRILYEQLILPFHLRTFDIYFSPTPVMPLLSHLINRNVRHVITIHDMIPFFVPDKYGKIRSVYVKVISILGARFADNVVTVSENSKDDICSLTKVDASKITVVYNFIPADAKSAVIHYKRFFVSISTIEPGKNIENTILGFKSFVSRTPFSDFKFYWLGRIGWGYTNQSLDRMIRNAGLEDKFFILGYVGNEKKTELLSNCSAMVYLSHYEGFGLPILEAFQYYKPSVASRNSSLPEVVGAAGVLCDKECAEDVADGLEEVVNGLDKYVMRISERIAKFSQESQLAKFLYLVDLGSK